MNILFLTLIDFDSITEKGIYTDLLRVFASNNHVLYIVSPREKKKNIDTEIIASENVNILKPKIGNYQKTNIIEKGITTLTIDNVILSSVKKHFKFVKFDLILYSTPPITFTKTIRYIKHRDNSTTYLMLKDIFPQNAVDLGILKKNGFTHPLYLYFRFKEKLLYQISDYIGCMSKYNVKYVSKHNSNLDSSKIELCPNSIEIKEVKEDLLKVAIRNKFNLPVDEIILLFGGNLGKPQAISNLVEAIDYCKDLNQIHFLVVGSGTESDKVINFSKTSSNLTYLSQVSKIIFDDLIRCADVGLIFLDKRFTIPNFPSRILSYLENHMPIITMANDSTDLGSISEKFKFGYFCQVDDYKCLYEKLTTITGDEIINMGYNGYKYLVENYNVLNTYNTIINHMIKETNNV